mmetsp:Transcript_20562/g.44954  ORF Transcript_20562/g.44954 Transcript_20562/m.44954 type:complete len:81 (-) Transcript_20562:828-1070(-)
MLKGPAAATARAELREDGGVENPVNAPRQPSCGEGRNKGGARETWQHLAVRKRAASLAAKSEKTTSRGRVDPEATTEPAC